MNSNNKINMKKVPTAEEFLRGKPFSIESIHSNMIVFAAMHVRAALKEASENAEVRITENALNEEGSCYTTYDDGVISATCDKKSILNAYPLENIK
jgi:hypothetical protein